MDPETLLFLILDREGQIIAFPTLDEAQACTLVDATSPGVMERTYGWLLENHPKALVRIYSQYYWAKELA